MTSIRRLALLLASTLLLLSCGAPEEDTTIEPTNPSGTRAPDVVRAVDDLAASLGVDADEVEVVAVEEVSWNNGSRGCAEPGMMYTQAIVEGARITLRVGATDYEYHSGGSRPPARCDRPTQ